MSKISLKPNDSGTGTFTLESPNSNTNRTLTLPDEAGAVLTNASDLSAGNLTGDVAADRITGALNATGTAPIYACRAWVNFNGDGTVSIRESGNVSSITDRGQGKYTVNFATNMPDSNYAPTIAVGHDNITGVIGGLGNFQDNPNITASSCSVINLAASDTNFYDFSFVNVAFFR